ncbi:response regulator [Terasakiella pusilla]|uniref:response regulator n=1 Tax=Terasakiella pusilla TaxID=64973 RepID=UPI00048BB46C|nr:two-component system response regulator [Terasakiella pusilla]
MTSPQKKILIVDDEPVNLQVLKQILQDSYQLVFAKNGQKAIEFAQKQSPDLILMDIMMPDMNGYETVRRLKQDEATKGIPVIFVTAMVDVEDEKLGFDVGAVDYISKPVSAPIVQARVRTHLSLVRVEELHDTRLEIIRRLGHAAEFKDNETGLHVIRMSHYSMILGRAAGMDDEEAERLLNAAPMHDIGKIGIPDHILLKPGKLDKDEWETMQKHPEFGARIIGEHKSPLLKLASQIALTHHEKWDGSGYPKGLKGEEIPLAGRIVAIADVFDALTTQRPYKEAWPVEKAIALIEENAGSHFDPALVNLFLHCLPEILDVRERWKEE